LSRLVVGRLVDLGLEASGGALVAALWRLASARDVAAPAEVAFAVRLLAHAFWLDHLYTPAPAVDGASELGLLLSGAFEVAPALVFPPDVGPALPAAATLRVRLERLHAEARARAPERLAACAALC